MIAFRNLAIRRGPRLLFSGVDAVVHAGWRLAVVGRNGCGKSSLLAVIRGELESDAGQVDLPANIRMASVAQETPALPDPAIDHVLGGDVEAAAAVLAAERAERDGDHEAAARAHQRIVALQAYDARARAGRLLHGLGFAADVHRQPVREFSGGWRVRLNLARALMAPSDLLLLDEPTNHLDLDAVLWLEQWLRRYQGAMLVISHDREFLDAVATHTLHLAEGSGRLYSGNYSAFERQRAEQLQQQQASFEREQAEREHLEAFIRRFGAKATKARQAQSRVKRLQKLAGTEAVRAQRAVHFHFPQPARVPQSLLKLVDAELGYAAGADGKGGDAGSFRAVLGGVSRGLDAGDRIGLLGANGAGKTTLVRALTGELPLHVGTRTAHKDLRIGYFAQHTVESLRAGASPFQHLRALAPDAPAQALQDWLGRWQLGGERAADPVDHFSGGERARLALALIAWQQPNLLLLDEPTNHLDMDMREALAEALNDFDGALLLVSHDRHLLGLVCDGFWHVAHGRVQDFDGDLDEYAEWSRKQRAATESTGGAEKPGKPRPDRQQRDRLKQWRRELQKVEKAMAKLEGELGQVEHTMAQPDTWQQPTAELARLGERQNRLRGEQGQLEAQWLELADQIERAEA